MKIERCINCRQEYEADLLDRETGRCHKCGEFKCLVCHITKRRLPTADGKSYYISPVCRECWLIEPGLTCIRDERLLKGDLEPFFSRKFH